MFRQGKVRNLYSQVVACLGMARYDEVRYGKDIIFIGCGMFRLGMVWFGKLSQGKEFMFIRLVAVWSGLIR